MATQVPVTFDKALPEFCRVFGCDKFAVNMGGADYDLFARR